MRERVLLQVVRLDELHAALAADVRPDVFVLHHVVLKLARVLEGLLALGTPAGTQGHSVTEPNGELKTLKQPTQMNATIIARKLT